MSILPAQTIRAEIAAGRLVRNADAACVQSCSYDLRIGSIFQDGRCLNEQNAGAIDQVELKPGGVISMFTHEELMLPTDVCATVFPLNSQSSRGLLVLNPGHVDAGFSGAITVKLLNISKHAKILKLKEPIFTAIFDRLEHATSEPYGNASTTRVQRETAFAENDLNVSPGTLSKLVGEPNDEQINKLIRSHWLSWVTLALTAGAFVFAVIAALPVFKDARSSPSHAGQLSTDATPSTTKQVQSVDTATPTSTQVQPVAPGGGAQR
jgi:deoxycytidine triphosphate deaminase